MTDLLSIQSIFSQRLFRIPDYQRGYAWGSKEWQDLVDDLELLPDGKDHFTGTLVVSPAGGNPVTDSEDMAYTVHNVVDGQQRLATIVILLDAIRDQMESIPELAGVATGLKRYLVACDPYGRPIPKLRLGRHDHAFFFEEVLGFGSGIAGPTLMSHHRLQGAHDFFVDHLSKRRESLLDSYPAWLRELSSKVTKRMKLILYSAASEEDAFVIFETMNDRGKEITETDKVKTHLLYLLTKLDLPAGPGDVRQINEAWGRIFRQLMRGGLISKQEEDRLLRIHWLTAYDYDVRRWADSRSIKEHFNLRAYEGRRPILVQDIDAYVKSLEDAAIAYADIYNPLHTDSFNGFAAEPELRAEIRKASEQLRRLGSLAPLLPVLIAVRLRYPHRAECYRDTVVLCERFAFRVYAWRNVPQNVAVSRLTRIGFELFKGRISVERALNDLRRLTLEYCTDQQFAARFDAPENWYEWDAIRYFLYEYEEHVAGQQRERVRWEWSNVERGRKSETVEHILPQQPDPVGYWAKQFSPDVMEKYTHDIGNLTLTRDNSTLGVKPFPEKKGTAGQTTACYANSVVFIEKALAAFSDWNEDAIQARRSEIRKWAIERWKVDQPVQPPPGDERDLMVRVLTRIPVPNGQRALFKALYEAGDSGLTPDQLCQVMGRKRSELTGVLGALGNRVERTPGKPRDRGIGILLFLEIAQRDGQWRYWLQPAFRALLQGDEVAHLGLLK